jgi:hypothetical protein
MILSLTGCTQTAAYNSNLNLEVNLAGDVIETGMTYVLDVDSMPDESEMMIYKIDDQAVTADSVQKIGKGLGLSGDTGLIDRDTKYAMLKETEDGEVWQLSVWVNSGAVEYMIVYPDKLYPSIVPDLPSEEEAKTIAVEFLQETGLWPSDADEKDIEIIAGGTYEEADSSTGEILKQYNTHLLVRINRSIDGYRVEGAGSDFSVRIGDDSEVLSVFKSWRNVAQYEKMKVKTAMAAYKDLQAGLGVGTYTVGCSSVVIQEVSLVYWMESIDDVQEYLLPVYLFSGECLDADGKVIGEFEAYCEAILD